jgi:hypothetical protein
LYVAAHEGPASSMMVGPKTAYPEFFNIICQRLTLRKCPFETAAG